MYVSTILSIMDDHGELLSFWSACPFPRLLENCCVCHGQVPLTSLCMHVWRFSCKIRRQAHGRVVSTSTRNARRESHFERESHQMKCANMRCTISRGECCLMSLDPLSNLPPHCTLTLAPAPPHAPRSSFLLQTRARHGTVSCCWMRRLFILISSLHS